MIKRKNGGGGKGQAELKGNRVPPLVRVEEEKIKKRREEKSTRRRNLKKEVERRNLC